MNRKNASFPYDPIMQLSSGEIIVLVSIGVALATIVGGYMIYTRKKGWM